MTGIAPNYRLDPAMAVPTPNRVTASEKRPLAKFNTEHTFLRKFGTTPSFGAYHAKPFLETLKKACIIFLKVVVFAIFYRISPFAFLCGIVWDESCYAAIQRIKAVWDHQNLWGKSLLTVGAILGLPVVIVAAGFFSAASVGAELYQALPFE